MRVLLLIWIVFLWGCASPIDVGKKQQKLANTEFSGNPYREFKHKINQTERIRKVEIVEHPAAAVIPNRRLSRPLAYVLDDVIPAKNPKVKITKAQVIIALSRESYSALLNADLGYAAVSGGLLGMAAASVRNAFLLDDDESLYRYKTNVIACIIDIEDGDNRISIDEAIPFKYDANFLYPDPRLPNFNDPSVVEQIQTLISKCKDRTLAELEHGTAQKTQ